MSWCARFGNGGDNIEIIKVSEWEQYARDDFLELAQYLLARAKPGCAAKVFAVGDKGYVCSRNLAKPVRESQLVDDNVTITAPPGAEILDRDERQNGYGCYTYTHICCLSRGRRRRQNDAESNSVSIFFCLGVVYIFR